MLNKADHLDEINRETKHENVNKGKLVEREMCISFECD